MVTRRRLCPQLHQARPISTKPHGVPLPHRGYTFDSAGLASATQPTLGNSASEEATPLGVVLFLIAHHHHTRRMISRMQIDFKKYNADGIGSLPPPLPRVASYRRQPWAIKSTTPIVLIHVHRFPNKQTKPPTRNPPKRNCRGGAYVPARTSVQRRFHAKNARIVHGEFNDGCTPAGRRGRAHRPAPTNLHHIFPRDSTQTK